MNTTSSTAARHAVMVCSPGMGHLIPLLELSKRLASLHSFESTILFVTTSRSSKHTTTTPPHGVEVLDIPAADISRSLDPGAQLPTKIYTLMRETGPAVRAAIFGLTKPITLLIFDMFATEYVSMAKELGLPKFVYIPCSAWFLALSVHCPALDKAIEGEYVEHPRPIGIPGCKPVPPRDVVQMMWQRTDAQYKEYLRMAAEIPLFDGVLVNTWQGLEGRTLAALRDPDSLGGTLRLPVFDIGPLTRTVDWFSEGEGGSHEQAVLEWLDLQPDGSVLYVSFGSGGTLSMAQMAEVACGLELSQQRFVWVVRPPLDGEASGSYFGQRGHDSGDHFRKYLPGGFIERTRDVGMLVPLWAPQTKILGHPSVGGFLTHCGWNSTLESVTSGVPMIGWPMFAEQGMNAAMLVEELGVAVRPREVRPSEAEVVGRKEIEEMVRSIMEGEEGRGMRRLVEDLQKSAIHALGDGGSSFHSLSRFVE